MVRLPRRAARQVIPLARQTLAASVVGVVVLACGSNAAEVAVPPTPVPATSTNAAAPTVMPATPADEAGGQDAASDEAANEATTAGENDLSGRRDERRPAAPTTESPEPTEEPTLTATPPPVAAAEEALDPATTRALITATDIVVPVLAGGPGGWWVFTPCAEVTLITGAGATPITGATVMIDPGHGGDETGAVGPTGLIEGDVNLEVANRLLAWLADRDIDAVTTRTHDYRIAIHARGELAKAVQPDLFVSIHHNGGFPEAIAEPGTEVYFQHDNPESKRLGGLLYEEIYDTIESIDIEWYGNDHRGTQWRLNQEGFDLYGVLRRPAAAGVVAALTEATFIQTEEEEELLTDPEFLQAEAEAIGRAIERWLTTADAPDDAAARYNDGIVFQGSLGPGGGTDGCVDPPLE